MGTTPQRKGDPPGSTWRFHGQSIDLKRLTNIPYQPMESRKKSIRRENQWILVKDDAASRRTNYEDIYNDWLNYYQDQLNGALDRMVRYAQNNAREFDLPRFAAFIEDRISEQVG